MKTKPAVQCLGTTMIGLCVLFRLYIPVYTYIHTYYIYTLHIYKSICIYTHTSVIFKFFEAQSLE